MVLEGKSYVGGVEERVSLLRALLVRSVKDMLTDKRSIFS